MISPGSGNITATVANMVEYGPGLDSLIAFLPTLSLLEEWGSRCTNDFVQKNDLPYVKLKRLRDPALCSLTFLPLPSVVSSILREAGELSLGPEASPVLLLE